MLVSWVLEPVEQGELSEGGKSPSSFPTPTIKQRRRKEGVLWVPDNLLLWIALELGVPVHSKRNGFSF